MQRQDSIIKERQWTYNVYLETRKDKMQSISKSMLKQSFWRVKIIYNLQTEEAN